MKMLGHTKKWKNFYMSTILTTYIIQLIFYLLHYLSIIYSLFYLLIDFVFLCIFKSMSKTSVVSPPNTAACMSLTSVQANYLWFFSAKGNLHMRKYTNLDTCIYLCNPKSHHDTEYYHHPSRKFSHAPSQ